MLILTKPNSVSVRILCAEMTRYESLYVNLIISLGFSAFLCEKIRVLPKLVVQCWISALGTSQKHVICYQEKAFAQQSLIYFAATSAGLFPLLMKPERTVCFNNFLY